MIRESNPKQKGNEMNCEIEPVKQQVPAEAEVRRSASLPVRRPAYRTIRSEHSWEVLVDLPGVSRDGIELKVEDGILKLDARREAPAIENRTVVHREVVDLRYLLRLEIGSQFDPGAVRAKSEDGILRVVLPIAEAAKPVAIPVD